MWSILIYLGGRGGAGPVFSSVFHGKKIIMPLLSIILDWIAEDGA
jgi:hypothetical protein